ncbi:unnamed protein product [Adineta steineri]|uniref:Uncharacterized protein n=2 Tax=Adineta steineri TaxID=433720 RepID=A0A813YXQ6_9BILA|nr:unnamed protein product [Adineta steineri]
MASGARIVSRLFVEENGAFDDVQVDKHEDIQKEAFTEETNNEVANSPTDLLTYQTNMERILQWITTLEEKYGNQDKTLSNDLNIIKEQFQNHEDFILTLNKDENQVDDILSQVNQLLTSTDIPLQTQEENEIIEQIGILNEKWRLLRSKSLDRQSILHKTIMKLQTDQMESFATWLSQIEERISTNLEAMEDSIPGIDRQYQQLIQLQDELIVQQEISQSLENFIIAVDDSTSVDQEYDSTEIENKLVDCSKRWEYICNFVQQHWVQLQEVKTQFEDFEINRDKLDQWLTSKEDEIRKTNTKDTDKVHFIQQTESEIDDIQQVIHLLDNSLNLLGKYFDPVSSNKFKILNEQRNNFEQRLTQLIDDLQQCSLQLKQSDDSINKNRQISMKSDFDLSAEKHIEWIDNIERILNEELQPEEQEDIIRNVKITYLLYDDDHFKEFIQTGNNITKQLKDADEDSTEHEFALKTLKKRWHELHEQILKCEQDIEQSKFSNDLSEYITRF